MKFKGLLATLLLTCSFATFATIPPSIVADALGPIFKSLDGKITKKALNHDIADIMKKRFGMTVEVFARQTNDAKKIAVVREVLESIISKYKVRNEVVASAYEALTKFHKTFELDSQAAKLVKNSTVVKGIDGYTPSKEFSSYASRTMEKLKLVKSNSKVSRLDADKLQAITNTLFRNTKRNSDEMTALHKININLNVFKETNGEYTFWGKYACDKVTTPNDLVVAELSLLDMVANGKTLGEARPDAIRKVRELPNNEMGQKFSREADDALSHGVKCVNGKPTKGDCFGHYSVIKGHRPRC